MRLEDIILDNIGGGTPSKSNHLYWNGNLPWASVKDLDKDDIYLNNTLDKITQLGLENSSSNIIPAGNVILCTRMGLGKVAINKIDIAINQDLRGILFHDDIVKLYFIYFFKTLKLQGQGLTVKGLPVNELNNIFFPLPPLNEQKRIVAKLEEILPFIDEYDKKEQKLTALNQQFPEQLKKSILQAAIQGKLVEQDPNDEPASELIKRIQAEKEWLISEKKIKKPKVKSEIILRDNLPYEIVDGVERCIADEVPFEIPENWSWVRFDNFVNFRLGKTPARNESKYWNEAKYAWISISDINDFGIINETKEKISEIARIECFNDFVPKNTLIMSFKLSIGKVSITKIESFHNEAIISIIPYINIDFISRNYLFYILKMVTDYIPKTTAIKGNTLNSALISEMFIPVPPLTEQKRIVQKIEELFSHIEYLK